MMFKYMCLVLFITWYQLADCHPAKSDVQSIDSMVDKETEAFLNVEAEQSSHKNVRDKRTIGFLRQLFPNLSQIVDRKIQQITRLVFRVIGRLVLRGGGAGAGAGGGTAAGGGGDTGSTGGRRISITLPTYPPSADDEEEEDQTVMPADTPAESKDAAPPSDATDSAPAADSATADSATAASADSATTAAADSATAASTESATAAVTNAAAITTANVPAVTTIAPTTQTPADSDNTVRTGIVKRTAREVPEEESSSSQKRSSLSDTESDVTSDSDSSNTNSDAQVETTEDEQRNKRFLFNLRGGGSGGSGNFLFDLIRLVAGSGANQDRDESNVASIEGEAQEGRSDVNAKEDGYSVGVPGPLTRIFVIANRGVANLVQDLILRLAQTTERIVNFKARLITSLI